MIIFIIILMFNCIFDIIMNIYILYNIIYIITLILQYYLLICIHEYIKYNIYLIMYLLIDKYMYIYLSWYINIHYYSLLHIQVYYKIIYLNNSQYNVQVFDVNKKVLLLANTFDVRQ